MKRQQGFTLIELVIVLVVLGILAAIAIPRFASLQREARITVVKSFYNSLRSGQHIVYAKAAANGLQGLASSCVDMEGPGTPEVTETDPNPTTCLSGAEAPLMIAYGLPAAHADIRNLFDDLGGWNITVDGGTVVAQLNSIATCSVTYTQATATARSTIVRNTDGC